MKITEDNEPFPGNPPHFWGVMSDGNKLPDFTPDYAEACLAVDAGPAFRDGGQSDGCSCSCDGFGRYANTTPLSLPSTPRRLTSSWIPTKGFFILCCCYSVCYEVSICLCLLWSKYLLQKIEFFSWSLSNRSFGIDNNNWQIKDIR